MIALPPVLDGRDEAALLAELRQKVAGYLPGWRPRPQGSGDALLTLLAHFGALVVAGLNQAPDKDFLAFLDAMGITLMPPQAARAPLVFSLAPATPVDVQLGVGTEVAADRPPALPSSLQAAGPQPPPVAPRPLIFSTDRSISLARATLAAVHSRVPALDKLADHTPFLGTGLSLFDPSRLSQVAHHLYLGHDTLFDLPGRGTITVQANLARGAGAGGQSVDLAWEYLTQDGWLAFEPVIDQTGGFASDGEVQLRKVCGAKLSKGTVNGIESLWIRARVDQPLPLPQLASPTVPIDRLQLAGGPQGNSQLPSLDTIRARVGLTTSGLPLDAASSNGFGVDTSKDFYPFGTQPALSSTFLIACDDAFRRAGARIDLVAPLSTAGTAVHSPLSLVWEYSTGAQQWTRLSVSDSTSNFTTSVDPAVSFTAPSDWQKTQVAGDSHYWLRVRIASGDYGGPVVYKVDGSEVKPDPTTVPKAPVIKSLTVSYTIDTGTIVPDHCLTYNEFSFTDHTEDCRWGHRPFQPFLALSDRQPAVYLGFDSPLPVGLVSIYADAPLQGELGAADVSSPFTWEYRSPEGWSELAVLDETGGFLRSGMVQFIGPPDLVTDAGPAGLVYWVRARLEAPTPEPDPVPLQGLFLNATWATQRSSVIGEVAGYSDGSPHLTFNLQQTPVLGQEVVEVQEWRGRTREWQSLFQDVPPGRIRTDQDARGTVTGVWITWAEQPHLYSSGRQDRHYTLDRSSGLLRFGDGVLGMIPPPGSAVAVSYDYGGGPAGNVGSGTVSQLHSAVPYVQSVTNPVAAGGGAAEESPVQVRARGPQRMRNRDRALSAEDYEWLAREASTEVAVARCLLATGPVGPGQPGWVTMVIAPWSAAPQPQPSVELMRRVRDHLAARCPAAIAGQIRVSGAAYLPVSVHAQVALAAGSGAAGVEEQLKKALDGFLHPLTGGPDSTGWAFGEAVHLSQVAKVMEGVAGVDLAVQVQLTSEGRVFGDQVPVPPDRLPSPGRHLLKLVLEA